MVNVIPAPARVDSLDEGLFVLSRSTRIVAASGLAPLMEWFAAELAASIAIDVGGAVDASSIYLVLVTDDPGLANLPATGGIRADGGDRGWPCFRAQ